MFKQLKGFIVGVICGALLLGAIGVAFAQQRTEVIEAVYDDIKIYIDGAKIEPKDANGDAVEPFIYNGTTYLPVRAVGEVFGKPVEWDGVSKSVYIGTKPEQPGYLTHSEIVVNGVSGTIVSEELIALLGEPDSIENFGDDDYTEWRSCDYGNVQYGFEVMTEKGIERSFLNYIEITGITNQSPRDIKVGDSFESVLNKFPQEKDYRTDERSAFYGLPEHASNNFGWVDEGGSGDFGYYGERYSTIIVASETGSFIKVHFEDGFVIAIQVFMYS